MPQHLDLERLADARIFAAGLVAAAAGRMHAHRAREAFGIAHGDIHGCKAVANHRWLTERRARPLDRARLRLGADLQIDVDALIDADLVALRADGIARTHAHLARTRGILDFDRAAADNAPTVKIAVV